jgi:hypothetical protein
MKMRGETRERRQMRIYKIGWRKRETIVPAQQYLCPASRDPTGMEICSRMTWNVGTRRCEEIMRSRARRRREDGEESSAAVSTD